MPVERIKNFLPSQVAAYPKIDKRTQNLNEIVGQVELVEFVPVVEPS